MTKIKFKAHTEASHHFLDAALKSGRGAGLQAIAAFAAMQVQLSTRGAFPKASDPNPGGKGTWKPRKKEYPHPILRKTGTLWADVKADFEVHDAYAKIFAEIPESSPAADYGSVHQFGSSKNNLPARPFAGMTIEAIKRVEDFMAGRLIG